MKVILLKNIDNLGKAGEVKEVNGGYARNFLLPQGLVEFATKHSLRMLQAQKQKREKAGKLEVKSKKSDIKKLSGKEVILTVKADEKGTLYKKVSAKMIADTLQQAGHKVEPKEIRLGQVIKKTGEYNVKLEMAGEKAMIRLRVEKEK